MEEQLISFETAVLAKEKGFNEKTYYAYWRNIEGNYFICDNVNDINSELLPHNYSAPTQSLLQKWLREKHFIFVEISLNFCPKSEIDFGYGVCVMSNINKWNNVKWFGLDITGEWYKSYELALESGLQEALKLIN